MTKAIRVVEGFDAGVEVTAKAIADVAAAMTKLRTGPLTERTLCLLIADAIPGNIGIKDVKAVLEGMENLAKVHLHKRVDTHPELKRR